MTPEEARAKRREWERARVAADPEAYRARNREKMRKRRLRDKAKVNEQKNRYSKQRRERDPDGVRAMYGRRARSRARQRREFHAEVRQKERAKFARQHAARPWVRQAQRQRRIARQHAAPGCGVSAKDWRLSLADALGLCAYCNEHPPKLTMDHIEPLSRGGAHDPANIVAACDRCNKSKNDLPLVVWMAKRRAA